MRSKGSSFELLVLLMLFCSLNAAVIKLKQGDACANVCSGKESIFKYDENKIYVYNFLSRHSIKNPNSKEETLQLELTGKAEISKITACDFGLSLSDVKLKESLKEKSAMNKEYDMMKILLEKYDLRFGFDDGRVTGVCPDKMDNDFAVNIKRGILSSLQVSIDSLETPNYLTETDIAGECITEYIPKSEAPNFVIITKKKSIAGCSRKSKYFTTLTGKVYDKPKESRKLALLDGDYKCEIKIKVPEGLKESICEEKHIFKPFRSETEGSMIVINQELRFDSIKGGKILAKIPTSRSDLTMNHGDKKPLHMKQELSKPLPIVKELCAVIKGKGKTTKVTELFVNLIRSMGETSYEDIKSLDKYISDDAACKEAKSKTRNILIDALTKVKTDAAFKFLIEDAKVYKLSKLGLSIFTNPTATMIATLTKKLDDDKSYNSITTILSSMIKSYCETNSGCMLNPDITNAMNSITKVLGSDCTGKNKAELKKIQYSLRAVGNAGGHPDMNKIVSTLKACATKKSNDDDIQIFSVQAVRQFPCNEDVDKFLWDIFLDISLSSELRIESYLSLVRCPTRAIFGQVIEKLRTENSQQLGSFVWSHISNLMETADRFKIDIRDMLQIFTKPMAELEKKFNLDFRSYSKNIEKSYQRGYSAAKVDTNIIFSSSSPIPSSININTTVDLFGRSFNLLELGIRGKGISEKIFGTNFKPTAHASPNSDIVKMDRKISKPVDKLSVSMYTRFMGREIYFNPNVISDILDVMMKSSKEVSLERSLLLLDLTLSIGSISGFPIELQIESAASIDYSFMKNEPMKLTDIELSNKINMGIQVTGKLLVNAHCTKIGIQSKGLLSRDLEFGGKLKLNDSPDGSLSDYQFELNKIPDNSKLFAVSNELSLIHKLEKVQAVQPYKSTLNKCSGEGLMKIMGIKICVALNESPKFSSYLSNFNAEVNIEKFSGLKIQWKKESTLQPVKKLKSLLLSVSFPGAEEDTFRLKVERDSKLKTQQYEVLIWQKMIYLNFKINDKTITGDLKSGKTQATLSGTYSDTGMFKSEINVDIKSDKDTGKLYFGQKFTKAGPEITIKLTKNGEKGFNLNSKTTVQMTGHKIFNKFERFRHSTNLKYFGENEMSLIIEKSTGNKPAMEIKTKLELFWKTKSKTNFYVRQNYIWEKKELVNSNDLFKNVPGTYWTIKVDHEIDVKGKKQNISNTLEYFISKKFFSFGKDTSLVFLKFNRVDLQKQESLLDISSMLGMDIANMNDGKIFLESILNYRKNKFNRKFVSKLTWKQNKIQMYDIEAKLIYEKFFELYFNHKFATTQQGTTSIELKIVDDSYKISSVLNLPKKHELTIAWPQNIITIDSDVEATSLKPFNLNVNHKLQKNSKLLATIKNTATFDNTKKELFIGSLAKSDQGQILYNITTERSFNYDYNIAQFFFEYTSLTSIDIPSWKINHIFENEQYLEISFDGKVQLKKKTLKSKITLEDLTSESTDTKNGYELTLSREPETVPFNEIKLIIFKGINQHNIAGKYENDGYNTLVGYSIDLKNKLFTEMMYKLIRKGKTATSSFLYQLDSKTNPNSNCYFKKNTVYNWENENTFSMKWTGEQGKSKTDSNLSKINGLFTFDYKGSKKVDINLSIDCPNACMNLANIHYVLSYNIENKEPGSYLGTFKNIIKWQKIGSRTSNYYDLQSNGNLDTKFKKIEFDLVLTKDTSTDTILSMKLNGVQGKKAEVSFKFKEKFAKASVTMDLKGNGETEMNLSLTTSNDRLKEFTVNLEKKMIEKTNSMMVSFGLKSVEKDYNLKISRLQKKDFDARTEIVENIKWDSNIPYISSGSSTLGFLVQNKNVQCNLGVFYDKKSILDIKINTSDILKNLNIVMETNIRKPLKFLIKYSKDGDTLKGDIDLTYDQYFFRMPNIELTNKVMGTVIESTKKMTILTSFSSLKEVKMSRNMKLDFNNILSTLKSELELTLNGNPLVIHSINLPSGKIKMKSFLVKYFTILKMQSVEIDVSYAVKSKTDFLVSYTYKVDDKPTSELKLEYFRLLSGEKSKSITNLGEALFYLNLEIKRQSGNGKITVFINKDKKNALLKMQADCPQINMKFDEVTMKFNEIKDSNGLYSGMVTYKGSDYTFTYKVSPGYKRELQIMAKSKGNEPQKVDFAFDFNKGYMVKLSFDKYFIVDVNYESKDGKNYVGKIRFDYKGQEKINVEATSTVTAAKDVMKFYDYLLALIGLKGQFDLKFKLGGIYMKKTIKSDVRIFHLHSDRYSQGTKSYVLVDLSSDDGKVKSLSIMNAFDRKFPNFKYEDDVKLKIDGVELLKKKTNILREDNNVMEIEGEMSFENFQLRFVGKNNDKMFHNYLFCKTKSEERGFGVQWMKKDFESSLSYSNSNKNCTFKTNLGYLIKSAKGNDKQDILPVGKSYFMSAIESVSGNKVEIKLTRKNEKTGELLYDSNWDKTIKTVSIKVYDTRDKDETIGLEIQFNGSNVETKNFIFKSNAKISKEMDLLKLTTNLDVNKQNKGNMELTVSSKKGKSPYKLDLKYKGSYIITGDASLDRDKLKFSHSITVKDGKYKTELWSCKSKCSVKSDFDCYYVHSNKAREIKLASIWKKKMKQLEFSWNKRKEHGFIFSLEKKDKKTLLTISTPIRTLHLTRLATSEANREKRQITFVFIRKSDPSKPVNVSLDIMMSGEISADYDLNVILNSNLLHKGIELSISRQIKKKMGDLYYLNIKSTFVGETKPFFTLEGNIRKITTRSYEVNMRATNDDKFLNLTAAVAVAYEEISFEYKIIQNRFEEREFIFKVVPFKKLLITNNRNFKILFSKTVYQYGYRRDVVVKLGDNGPDISAYSTLIKSPFKYYAEVISKGKKLVVDFRPVGNLYIGDIYRKISGSKVEDLKLRIELDSKNVLTTKLTWNPKFIDAVKTCIRDLMSPDNLKTLMVYSYQRSESSLSKFSSGMKIKILQNMNAPFSIELVKGIVNDVENIPKNIAVTYDDDDLYMKTIMDKMRVYLQNQDLSNRFENAKNSVKMSTQSMSDTLYAWCVEAKWYKVIYDPILSKVESISYDDIKIYLDKAINCGKYVAKSINSKINYIGNKLESLSKRAESVSAVLRDGKDSVVSRFKTSSVGQMYELLREVRDTMIDGLSQIVELDFVKQRLTYYNATISNVKELVSMAKDMTKNMLKYVKSRNIVENLIETLKLIKSLKYKEAFMNMIKPNEAKFEIDLNKGTMDMKFYVPPISRSVIKMWNVLSDITPVQIISRMRGAGIGGKLLTVFYRYEYLMFNYGQLKLLRNLLPPFKKTAWVLNGNSVLTFDGSSIRIGGGPCSYLLARDTTYGSFSLVMIIKPGTEGKEFQLTYINEVTLLSSGKVRVNGKFLESLPQLISDGKGKSLEIYRDNDMTKITTSEGLTIRYFNNLDYLKVTLDGFWHGKVKGLLGSNDFDIINDKSTVDGTITHDAGILSKSWSFGTCDSKTKTGLYSVRVNPKHLQSCADLFNKDSLSYLSRCHSLINPEPYYELCRMALQYSEMNDKTFEEHLCNLSRNYVVRCKTKGLMIRLKKSCIKCGKDKVAKESTKVMQKKDQKFNYIFIIEQSKCLLPYKSLLKNLVEMMALEKNNLYTLMSFNGLGMFKDAHFKTLQNEVTNDINGFRTLLKEFAASEHFSNPKNVSETDESSQAIFDAIKMPSKLGYIEKIVFIGCSTCGEHKKHIFSNLAGLLKNSGISLTYLTTQTFTGEGSSNTTAALGNNQVYTYDKDTLTSKTWLKDLQPPKDVCSNLAQIHGGFVWSLDPMSSEMRLRRASDRLLEEIKKVNGVPKQKCSCGTGNYEEGKIECKVTGLM